MKLYTSIIELPFYHFVKASAKQEYKYLIIEGEPTEDELHAAWYELQTQYAEAVGDSEQKYTLKLMKDLSAIETKYNKVVHLVFMLRTRYVAEFAKMLNKDLGTSFKFDITNLTTYDKELDRCLTRAKAFKIEYEKKALELENLLSKRSKDGQAPTEEYYYKLWNTVKIHHGLKDSIRDITTFDFCDFLQRMIKAAERQPNAK